MKQLLPALLFFLHSWTLSAQEGRLLEHNVTLFQLPHNGDTIEFVVVDTALNRKKPLFLWCQGSLPMPLFFEIEGMGMVFFGGGLANFDYRKIVEQYHLAVISMPKTPVMAYSRNLNDQYQFVRSKDIPYDFLPEYLAADYLENYVQRADKVIDFLSDQPWVSTEKIVVAGHSQGSKVAAKTALLNSKVTHLGLFAANPFGRADEFIRRARVDAERGNISWAQADSIMNQTYEAFKQAHNPAAAALQPELKTMKTFSEIFYDDWLKLQIPIYLAYGTADRTSDLCDLVPLFFIQEGKTNLSLKRYLNMEHNFFEVDAQGKPVYEKSHFGEVMEAFLEWLR